MATDTHTKPRPLATTPPSPYQREKDFSGNPLKPKAENGFVQLFHLISLLVFFCFFFFCIEESIYSD